jgi:hypothetical protein
MALPAFLIPMLTKFAAGAAAGAIGKKAAGGGNAGGGEIGRAHV